jgi:hypothetical protein
MLWLVRDAMNNSHSISNSSSHSEVLVALQLEIDHVLSQTRQGCFVRCEEIVRITSIIAETYCEPRRNSVPNCSTLSR